MIRGGTSVSDVSTRLKRLAIDLQGTLKHDPQRARADRLLLTAGAGVYICGSGGEIPYIYTKRVRVR